MVYIWLIGISVLHVSDVVILISATNVKDIAAGYHPKYSVNQCTINDRPDYHAGRGDICIL